ncbi:DUF397 domain-containing protein [Streptomyces roseochromogenus]|uniref:DUF397 domain-containing protein n=1 Tax=Streptomyces roseochromogenus TaxID=285450 RepID=UPI0031585CB4
MVQEQLQRPGEHLPRIAHPPPLGQAPVRDSKRPGSTVITFRASSWTSFIRAIAEDDVPSPPC